MTFQTWLGSSGVTGDSVFQLADSGIERYRQ